MVVFGIILVLYTLLIGWLVMGLFKIPVYQSEKLVTDIKFSIIIPFRNEEANLPDLLKSLQQLKYPTSHFEILLVDDASTDNSRTIIHDFSKKNHDLTIHLLENIRLTNSPKKDAIVTAIERSKNDWIFSTDADCVLPKELLQVYATFIIEKQPKFITAPVVYQKSKGFLYEFQKLDWMSLTGVTMGSFGWQKPLLCSGANMVYLKQAFMEVKGFKGNDTIASGDDIFLLQKMSQHYPNATYFLNNKEVIVKTKAEKTWKALWQQHLRWAAKTGSIPNTLLKFIGAIVVLMNVTMLILLFISIFSQNYFPIFLTGYGLKLILDYILFYITAKRTNQKISIPYFALSSLLYPLFSVAIPIANLFTNYTWKNRSFQQ